MKKVFIFLILLTTPLLGRASHIVGGEFELLRIAGFQYRLNMVLYFDEKNGNQGAKDPNVTVRIFRKIDNAIMLTLLLPQSSLSSVNYTQPACSSGELVTSKILYSALITLSAAQFSDPGGYYVSWERCCRNYGITNIFSNNPAFGGTYAGQTFYLEFPAVMKDGQQFVDSTPRLFPPLNDYACPGRPYYADFAGTDDDGDSLVYSLTTPLNTKTSDAVPPGNVPRPGPYPLVSWRLPFGITNIINGAPDLKISQDGFLTVTPTIQGLFVFAVKVEEFRNKVKIGETRRDFQMLVVDQCSSAVPPRIVGKKLSDATYTGENNWTVSFDNTVTDGNRCVMVQVSDEDSKSGLPRDLFTEQIRLKAIPLNFKANLAGILPTITAATLSNGSTAEFTICFPQCPYLTGGDPVIGIVALDDACSLPLGDTLKITLHVDAPFNTKPRFVVPAVSPVSSTLNEGDQSAWPFQVIDDDGDPLIVSVLTNGFALAAAGMTFNTLPQTPGNAEGELKWNAYCDIFDFTQRTAFQVTIQVEDQDKCLIPNPARTVYNLNVILPGNASPTIDTDLTPAVRERRVTGLTRRIDESLNFKVTGKDLIDNDVLELTGKAMGFAFADYGISINPTAVTANGTVISNFGWDVTCKSVDLKKRDTFDFQFIVVDNKNKCRIYKADTVDVSLKILPPLNAAPQLTIINQNSAATTLSSDNKISMILGENVQLLLTGRDADVIPGKDNLKLDLVKKDGTVPPDGYFFTPVAGTSPVQAAFNWNPDCTIFKDNVYDNEYSFTFRLIDDHCITAKKDSIVFKLRIKDVNGSDSEFIPPNFFSPNGDDINDYFAMEMKDGSTGELRNILPLDNCVSRFESIRIYDRWGNQVYQSAQRDFKWDGKGENAGVFFYFLKYTGKEYRGSVSLRY
ncbi:hypothetical protein BH09BAC3_BH09BAC3_07060 [soil metagenome]